MRKGFTLLEMIVAIALGGVILVAASSLLLSITQLWIKEESLDDFQGHVHGVESFLQTHFKEATYRINEKLPPVEWSEPPEVKAGIDEKYLSFYVYSPNPLFDMESFVPVVCYLTLDKQKGLSIIWHSFEEPSGQVKQAVFETLLSPWVKAMKYHYYTYDSNRWEVLDKPKKEGDKLELPDFLELQFVKDKEEDQSAYIRIYSDRKPGEVIL